MFDFAAPALNNTDLQIPTPRWAVPLHAAKVNGRTVRYRGAWSGRSAGKSHEFGGLGIERMVEDPNFSLACIREVQKSLKFSAKRLIERKIEDYNLGKYFVVNNTEILRKRGRGVCIFQGMQDHTADSVKSLEDFNAAWVEEAHSLSQRSLTVLRPTIRAQGSEIWASWNPQFRSDAIDKLLRGKPLPNAVVVRTSYLENPFLPDTMLEEAEMDFELDEDTYNHVWLGHYQSMGSRTVIPPSWIESAVDLCERLGIEPTGKRFGSLDVAGGEEGGDENAYAARHGVELVRLERWNGYDTSATTTRAVSLAQEDRVEELYYDSVSVGEGVTGEWASMGRRNERPDGLSLHPWNGGAAVLDPKQKINTGDPNAKTNEEQWHNLKAQGWFRLRKRFENAHRAVLGRPYDPDNIISISSDLPHLAQLKAELSQPIHKLSATGKTMVDKQPDGTASPNVGDAVMMVYNPLKRVFSYAGAL